MLIDEVQPYFDATRVEHRIVVGEPAAVYEAALRADFVRTGHENPAVRLLFGLRSAAERAVSALRGGGGDLAPELESMRLADLEEHGQFVLLCQDAPHEIAFGLIGRFWGGETSWEEIDAADFRSFDRPGFGKIACNLSLRPYGEGRTLLSYETRTQATDEQARRGFLRYWRPLSPFIGVVLRAQLRLIAEEAADNRPLTVV